MGAFIFSINALISNRFQSSRVDIYDYNLNFGDRLLGSLTLILENSAAELKRAVNRRVSFAIWAAFNPMKFKFECWMV